MPPSAARPELFCHSGGLSQAALDALCAEHSHDTHKTVLWDDPGQCAESGSESTAASSGRSTDTLATVAARGISQAELDVLSTVSEPELPNNTPQSAPEDLLYCAKRLRAYAGFVKAEAYASLASLKSPSFPSNELASAGGFDQDSLDAMFMPGDGCVHDEGGEDSLTFVDAALLRVRRLRAFASADAAECFSAEFHQSYNENIVARTNAPPTLRFARAQLSLDKLCLDDEEAAFPMDGSASWNVKLSPCEGGVQLATPQRRYRISMSNAFGPESPHKLEAQSPGSRFEVSSPGPGRGGA